MDYVDMIKRVQGKRYMLVVIDRFSRWVEAVPSADQGSGTVIKFLTREVILTENCKTSTATIENKAETRVYLPSSITRDGREIKCM